MPPPTFSDYLVDTGAIELLVVPPDESIAKFWRSLGDVKHAICEIVYWEFLRQFDKSKHTLVRQQFLKAIERGRIISLLVDREAADLAVELYQTVRRRLPDDKLRRSRLNELQCDIMIAAVAVRHRKIVVTEDVHDWNLLREAVGASNLGTLPLLLKGDMRDPRRWKH